MKPAVTLLGIFALILVLWSSAAVELTERPQTHCPVCITPDLYERVSEGMTYAQVREVIGAAPTDHLCLRGKVNRDSVVEIYTWTDASERAISVSFHDGVFRQKDQAWL